MVVSCCDDALAMDANSLKALYNRARARLLSPTSGGLEVDLAVADLQAGLHICSEDVAADGSVPASAFHSQLAKVQKERRKQSAMDKRNFGGMFDRRDRPALYEDGDRTNDDHDGNKKDDNDDDDDNTASAGVDGAVDREGPAGSSVSGSSVRGKKGKGVASASAADKAAATARSKEADAQWQRLTMLVKDLRAQGRDSDADELQKALDTAASQADGGRKGRPGKPDPRSVDFSNPTPEMRKEAEKMGYVVVLA